MGSTFAPSLGCLYMFDFESRFILPNTEPFQINIKLWRRYIDDILIVWQGSLSESPLSLPCTLDRRTGAAQLFDPRVPEALICCFRYTEFNTGPDVVPLILQEPRTRVGSRLASAAISSKCTNISTHMIRAHYFGTRPDTYQLCSSLH
ncbi:hypothetical protein NDU88_007088 [Pleurodeles waltl]|uniref:Reverse transcriptase n=1 Tax=Pleurodeles waltl TaxID=8319 RepID=A0AAV7NTY9_PLEWA|nr:hypothetical protein NDU88_007088 [Pleurodeles waltl]